MIAGIRQAWCLLRLGVHLALGMGLCALVFPWLSQTARERAIRWWSLGLLRLFGVKVELIAHAESTLQRGVVVANHLSWLDIFVINTLQPCRFVAKAEIRSWPLLGYLCSRTHTIFISRSSTRAVRDAFKQLAESIKVGDFVAFFPEGTTAAQGKLLPFHANLFEAAVDAGVPIQPLALRYLDKHGNLHTEIDYTGEVTFSQSLMRILRGPAVSAQLIVLPVITSHNGGRRALAQAARERIAAALDHPSFEEGT